LLHYAHDNGEKHFDTAALYGFGKNELLLGEALKGKRNDIFLASKCGMSGVDGKRVIDGRPSTLRKTLEQALKSLQTDVIDLYYLHRWDKSVPIEESVGELGRMVQEGKINSIGLSEVSATTLSKAHKEHAIAAVQTEYSLMTRNAEIAVLDKCNELGVAFVAFSPLSRGFFSRDISDPSVLVDGDIRKGMPRFQSEHLANNLKLLERLDPLCEALSCTPMQLGLAWVLHKGENIHVIPGTTKIAHLQENIDAIDVRLSASQIESLDKAFSPSAISGARYPQATQLEIDTEEFELV